MTEGYQYTGCGLDYVYLLNGYTIHESKHGKAVSISDARKLHEAIARDVIGSPRPIRGQEVRFLRAQMKLSQEGLARVLRQRRGSVARWESSPDKQIPGAADSALRMFYALKSDGHDLAVRLVDLLTEIDELEHQLSVMRHSSFKEIDGDWARAAA